MRIIPVLDVQQGRAVHAVGGDRAHYAPAACLLHQGSDPIGLALAYRDQLGLRELYMADLDAIAGEPPALPLYRSLADLGVNLWIDAGLRDGTSVAPLLDSASLLVAGLETLGGPGALAEILGITGPDRLVFSLDLRGGVPIVSPSAGWGTVDPLAIADRAVVMGVRKILLLDLARVGSGGGVGTGELAAMLHRDHHGLTLFAGGGVSGTGDLDALEASGFSGVLVGSALRDGRIGREDLTARASRRGFRGSGR